MHVLNTWNPPSAVYFSVKLGDEYLVLARASRIEVVQLSEEGLRHLAGVDVWGQVTSLNALNDGTGTILATTDHPRPMAFVIAYDAKTSALSVVNSVNLFTRSSRLSEFCQGAVIDSTTGIAVSLEYAGSLKVISLSTDKKPAGIEFDVRIPELNVLSMCFLPPSSTPSSSSSPILAILHIDFHLRRQLITRRIDIKEKEATLDDSLILPTPLFVDSDAALLIPVHITSSDGSSEKISKGGIIIAGGGSCQYLPCEEPKDPAASHDKGKSSPTKSSGKKKSVDPKASPTSNKRKRTRENSTNSLAGENPGLATEIPFYEVSAYDIVDRNRILIADAWGQLALLVLGEGPSGVESIKCVSLGEVSSTSTLTYLANGVFYVGSHYGDNQLARLLAEEIQLPSGAKSHVQVLDTFPNVAPISDALLSETEGSMQAITCSGGYNSGSLRIMRKSAEFKQLALIEHVNNVTTIWPLKVTHGDKYDRYLLLSTVYDTTLVDLGDGSGMEALEADAVPDLIRSAPTIETGNIMGQTGQAIVQVTTDSVRIVDLASGYMVSDWPPANDPFFRRGKITTASVNSKQVIVALQGGELVCLKINQDLRLEMVKSRTFKIGDRTREISALSIAPIWPAFPNESRIGAVGFWGSNSVELVDIPGLNTLPDLGFARNEPHLPRSVLLHTFGNETPFLLVGLADGSLIAYDLDHDTFRVKARRSIVLGNLPLRLTACKHSHNRHVVFVSGSRPAVVFLENHRLQHSPLSLKDVSSACMFNSAEFPDSLVLGNNRSLVIGQLDKLHELQIRTIPFGRDCPVKISHDPVNHMYGLAIIRAYPPNRDDSETSHPESSLRLISDNSYIVQDSFLLEPTDEIRSILSHGLICNDEKNQYWIIGSEILGATGMAGRLTVCSLQQGGRIEKVASVTLPGPVNDVSAIDGKIVVAAGAAVTVFELSKSEYEREMRLKQLSQWDRGYRVDQIRIHGDQILTLDSLRSIEVLQWKDQKLHMIARDHGSVWPVATNLLSPNEIIVAEGQGHIYSYTLKDGTLERAGAYYLGEQITQIIQGSVATGDVSSDVQPSVIFVTNIGRIGVISSVKPEFALLLTSLERNLSHALPGPGGIDHAAHRAPVIVDAFGESAQTGFVDGDFVERFLHFANANSAKKALEGANTAQKIDGDFDSIVQRLEQLQMVH